MAKKKTSSRVKKPKKLNLQKILTGIVLIFLGILVISRTIPAFRSQNALANGEVSASAFETKVDQESHRPGGPQARRVPTRIIIPSVGIDIPVKAAKIVSGYWEVFSDTAAWGEESGYPGEPGNQVIFAHARKGLFLPLKDITTGTKVYVMTKGEWYQYEVKEITAVYPNQKEVIAPTTDETLTLYTCTGYEDSKRLIVVAKRV